MWVCFVNYLTLIQDFVKFPKIASTQTIPLVHAWYFSLRITKMLFSFTLPKLLRCTWNLPFSDINMWTFSTSMLAPFWSDAASTGHTWWMKSLTAKVQDSMYHERKCEIQGQHSKTLRWRQQLLRMHHFIKHFFFV